MNLIEFIIGVSLAFFILCLGVLFEPKSKPEKELEKRIADMIETDEIIKNMFNKTKK